MAGVLVVPFMPPQAFDEVGDRERAGDYPNVGQRGQPSGEHGRNQANPIGAGDEKRHDQKTLGDRVHHWLKPGQLHLMDGGVPAGSGVVGDDHRRPDHDLDSHRVTDRGVVRRDQEHEAVGE